jgi:hypothetical protein
MSTLVGTLQLIENRPGMFFGDGKRSRSIWILKAFIFGFQTAQQPDSARDLDCFTEWVATHYHVLADGMDSYYMILEHVGGDERKAYDEFFRLLPDYLRDRQQLGWDSIVSRFTEIQDECMEAFREKSDKHDS